MLILVKPLIQNFFFPSETFLLPSELSLNFFHLWARSYLSFVDLWYPTAHSKINWIRYGIFSLDTLKTRFRKLLGILWYGRKRSACKQKFKSRFWCFIGWDYRQFKHTHRLKKESFSSQFISHILVILWPGSVFNPQEWIKAVVTTCCGARYSSPI